MLTTSTQKAAGISTYPGEYKPLQSKLETLPEELSRPHEGASSPADNICETSEYYKIELAAPGLKREDFFVSINDKGYLSISALRTESDRNKGEKYQEHNFNYDCFTREFQLPEIVDTYFAKADYNAGILSIWFSKTEKPYTKRASIVIVY